MDGDKSKCRIWLNVRIFVHWSLSVSLGKEESHKKKKKKKKESNRKMVVEQAERESDGSLEWLASTYVFHVDVSSVYL